MTQDAESTSQEQAERPARPSGDYYAVLGLSPDADQHTIAAAYNRLARLYQPDVSAPPLDPERMRRLDEAFDVLDDPVRRAEYDSACGVDHPPAFSYAKPGTVAASTHSMRRRVQADERLLLALGLVAAGLAAIIATAVLVALALGGDGALTGPEITTASGLKYIDRKIGEGTVAEPGKQVSVYYTGKLADGTVFDSRTGDPPFTFILGRGAVIAGWDKGVANMREGGKRTLTIPPKLAYGSAGNPPAVPPNATLTYDIEVLNVKDAGPAAEPAPATPPAVTGEEKTTASGLKYIDIEEGTGAIPQSGQQVTVHYTGWLQADGRKFDSSLDRGSPFVFLLDRTQVLKGWNEGISTMKVGGRRRLIIPPELAYGAAGSGTIPPNATLIFDVQLIDVR